MEIGYFLLKILRFYVFKMAANGGRHFEINMKVQNCSIYFSKNMHTLALLTTVIVYYVNTHFMGLFQE